MGVRPVLRCVILAIYLFVRLYAAKYRYIDVHLPDIGSTVAN